MQTCVSWDGEQCCRRKFSLPANEKTIFYFSIAKNGVFCEATTESRFQNGTTSFFKNTRPYYMEESPKWGILNLSVHPSWKRQMSAESAGSESNLNYSYIIYYSWFFEKIIFRFTICCLIIDPLRVLQESIAKRERSLLPYLPRFEIGITNSKKSKKWKPFAFRRFRWHGIQEK